MEIGIVSPVVTRVPGGHGAWEAEAGVEDLAQVAERADRLGFHHLTCSEHVAVPSDVAAQRGATYWAPSRRSATWRRARRGSGSRPRCSCSATTTRWRSRSATGRSTS